MKGPEDQDQDSSHDESDSDSEFDDGSYEGPTDGTGAADYDDW